MLRFRVLSPFLLLCCCALAHAASVALIVPAADGAYPLASEIGWRFAERASVFTHVVRTNSRQALTLFCSGERPLVLVARPMLRQEIAACAAKGVRFVELPFALDAVVVVASRSAKIESDITRAQLAALWSQTPSGAREHGPQIDPTWPDVALRVVGPAAGASELDYLEHNVVGGPLRRDYIALDDPDQVAMNVVYRADTIAVLDYSRFQESRHKLRAFPFAADARDQGVEPAVDTLLDARYPLLVKPLVLYVEASALADPLIARFSATVLELSPRLHGDEKRDDARYAPLPEVAYERSRERLAARMPGSRFGGELVEGARLIDLLGQR